MQIEEQIKGIEWLQPQGKYNKLVSTNERSIKVWKFFEKVYKKLRKMQANSFSFLNWKKLT